MEAMGKVAHFVLDPEPSWLRAIILPGGAIMEFFRLGFGGLLGGVPEIGEDKISDLWTKNPIPFFGAVTVAAMIMAGVDPGDVIVALTNLIPGL